MLRYVISFNAYKQNTATYARPSELRYYGTAGMRISKAPVVIRSQSGMTVFDDDWCG